MSTFGFRIISVPAADVTYERNHLLLMDAPTGHVCSTLFSVRWV